MTRIRPGAPTPTVSEIVFPAGQLGVIIGTPNLGLLARTAAYMMDAIATEDVGGVTTIPNTWTAMHVDLVWANAGAGTGACAWRFDISPVTTGAAAPDPASGSIITATAGAANIITTTRLATGITAPDGLAAFEVVRIGGDAADTLANDAGIIAVVFTRAS
jgi:hypothetical protein